MATLYRCCGVFFSFPFFSSQFFHSSFIVFLALWVLLRSYSTSSCSCSCSSRTHLALFLHSFLLCSSCCVILFCLISEFVCLIFVCFSRVISPLIVVSWCFCWLSSFVSVSVYIRWLFVCFAMIFVFCLIACACVPIDWQYEREKGSTVMRTQTHIELQVHKLGRTHGWLAVSCPILFLHE